MATELALSEGRGKCTSQVFSLERGPLCQTKVRDPYSSRSSDIARVQSKREQTLQLPVGKGARVESELKRDESYAWETWGKPAANSAPRVTIAFLDIVLNKFAQSSSMLPPSGLTLY